MILWQAMPLSGVPGLPQINGGQVLTTGVYLGGGLLIFILAIVATAIVMYIMKFNVPCLLYFRQGDAYKLKKDKGFYDKKKNKFELFKSKHILCDIPKSEHFFGDGKKDFLTGCVINNSCSWMKIQENKNFIPTDANMESFQAQENLKIDQATKIKEGFWDKYGHQVMWGMTIAIFMICLIFILQSVSKAIEMGGSVMTACQQVAVQLSQNITRVI